MRHLIVSSIFAAALLLGSSATQQANAAQFGSAVSEAAQGIANKLQIKCWRGAPYDGCGWGWRRNRWGICRPC